jgi:hypothetical protein
MEQLSLWSRVLDWLLAQAPAIVISAIALWSQNKRITALLRRNEQLSDVLMENVRLHSDERLKMTEKHAREREQLQTDHLLQHDATLRNILHSFEEGLLTRLGE